MISFDADPRTRLVVCGSVMAALSVLCGLLAADWRIGCLLAAPAILGYFAARLDWPLFAAGIGLTPVLAEVGIEAVRWLQGAGAEDLQLAMVVLPIVALLPLAAGTVGAAIGHGVHGGDWGTGPLNWRTVRAAGVAGVVLGIALLAIGQSACGKAGYDRSGACTSEDALSLLIGAIAGAVLLRSWVWPVMATAGVAVSVGLYSLFAPGAWWGVMTAMMLASFAGVSALAAVAWVRFAMEAAAMLRAGREAPVGA
ncbi:MAG: hypothetical protein ACKOWF_05165 [Chloroflexota bacterium]